MRLLALSSTYFGPAKPIFDDVAPPTRHPGLFRGQDEIYNDVSAQREKGDVLLSAGPPLPPLNDSGERGGRDKKCRVNLYFYLGTGSLDFVKTFYLFSTRLGS
ncbi:hypothetical protein TNIN_473861 [Trichonephila inaurata madagascariensis]|uniref:Uncharacterized protein n=1 Tax=Trichonephila inaurata madagascariensis TaxID=2747483 RepID=A0A8X7CSI5_9ARAC|nr:hypothetical protein TNIN_473861 [Trichonephila inaurata madagascariensis]